MYIKFKFILKIKFLNKFFKKKLLKLYKIITKHFYIIHKYIYFINYINNYINKANFDKIKFYFYLN